jgi:AcrR family transcriptional regulator
MYNKDKLYEMAIDAIQKNRLIFVDDIVAYLPCSRSTFYEHFPSKSDDYEKMFELLNKNRTELKVSMRSKWFRSENATLQLALMKLLSNDEELRKLSMQHQVNEEAEKPIFNGIDLDIKDDN